MSTGQLRLTWKKVGDWWDDERRFWCAYCGHPMRRRGVGETSATKDHIVPKSHGGRFVKIPACRKCNQAKADMSLHAFLESGYFAEIRKHKHKYQWPAYELWYALAQEAIMQATRLRPAGQPLQIMNLAPSAEPPRRFGNLL